jgi:hypothetical protein
LNLLENKQADEKDKEQSNFNQDLIDEVVVQ